MELEITIKEKLEKLLSEIRALRKRVSLFVVLQREDRDTWDLIIGGENLRTKENLDLIIKIIKKLFKKDEIVKLPRLILLNSSHPLLNSINRAFAVGGGVVKIENTRIDNVFIKNAYLFPVYSKSIDYTAQKEKHEVEEESVEIKDTKSSSTTQPIINKYQQ